jgi:hypothetical protein
VRQGEAELRKRFSDVEEQAEGVLRLLGKVVEPDAESPPPPTPTPVAEVPDEPMPEGPAVDELAIPDYDSLSASQVVTRLPGLAPAELEGVRAYEVAHRGRKTILNKVSQLQT